MDRDPPTDPEARTLGPAPATPEAALTRLVEALAAGDRRRPDHGIDAVYELASDALRSRVGGPDDLRRVLDNSLNRVWLGHRGVEVIGLEARGGAARAEVEVTAADGERARFTVALVRPRHGQRAGHWLLSGLAREGVDL